MTERRKARACSGKSDAERRETLERRSGFLQELLVSLDFILYFALPEIGKDDCKRRSRS